MDNIKLNCKFLSQCFVLKDILSGEDLLIYPYLLIDFEIKFI